MTNQMQGEILFAGWEGGSLPADANKWAYTPWMAVRGDIATFGVEVLQINGPGGFGLSWEVQTRTAEDPASLVTLVAGAAVTAPGVSTVANSANLCKELVRYRFCTGAAAGSTANYIIVRALQPSWQQNR